MLVQPILRKRFRTETKNYGQSFLHNFEKYIFLFGSNIFILEGNKKYVHINGNGVFFQ